MTEDQQPGAAAPEEPDDVAVRHPSGGGAPVEPAHEAPAPAASGAAAVPPAESESESADPETADADAGGPLRGEEPRPEAQVEGTDPEPVDDPARPADGGGSVRARRRTRDPLAAALIGVLTLLLGFAFAVQVRSVGQDQQYQGAREEDLVRILDELNAREERLRSQLSEQRAALQQLTSSDSQSAAALQEAQKRAEAIGILNGTIPAHGPGLVMTVRDPGHSVRVADLLDAIEELRGAGAETMQIDGVRVGVSTAVTGDPGSLRVDGRPITAPYEFLVIGSPQDMQTAMNIPGGVVPHISGRGGSVDIVQSDKVVVDALRPLDTPQYAQPKGGG